MVLTSYGAIVISTFNFNGYQIFPAGFEFVGISHTTEYSKSYDERWKTGHLYSSKVPAAFLDFVKRKEL